LEGLAIDDRLQNEKLKIRPTGIGSGDDLTRNLAVTVKREDASHRTLVDGVVGFHPHPDMNALAEEEELVLVGTDEALG
jgi:isopentenyl phosphate kinase